MRRLRVRIAMKCVGLAWLLLLSGCASVGCRQLDASRCAVLKDFQVFAPQAAMHFDHHCSHPGNHDGASRSAYVFFESESDASGKLLALSEVALGWVFGPPGGQGVRAKFHRMQIAGLEAWAGDSFDLRLGLRQLDGGEIMLGGASRGVVEFKAAPGPVPEYHAFALSSNGRFDWEQFSEPNAEPDEGSERVFGFLEGSHIEAEKIASLNSAYRLLLIAHNIDSGDEILMQGPRLDSLDTLRDLEKPEWATLGLLETLNPAEEGGLWGWFGTAAKFGDCIYARKAAKQSFDERFTEMLHH